MSEKIGFKDMIASSLHNLGVTVQDQGNLDTAKQLYLRSLRIKEELGNKLGIVATMHQLGRIEEEQGNLEAAKHLYQSNLKLEEELGDNGGNARTLHQLAMIEERMGNLEAALKLYVQALAIFSSSGYAEKEIVFGNLEKLRQKMGVERFEKALKEANVELPPLTRKHRKVPSPKNSFIPLALTGRGKGEGE